MSRCADGDYEEDFPNQGALWQANVERALNGKRGRRVLMQLREALLALPDKRLISSALCTRNQDEHVAEADMRYVMTDWEQLVTEQGSGVCVIGAYVWHQKVKAGMDPEQAFAELPLIFDDGDGTALDDTASLAKRETSMVLGLAWELAYMNDEEFRGCTPEERYTKFLTWIDARLGVPA